MAWIRVGSAPQMKILSVTLLIMSLLSFASSEGTAGQVVADVDLSEQAMRVYLDGEEIHLWQVSTGREGKATPRGIWHAQWLSRDHKSSLYNDAPMPYSIFFTGNYAIHGTNEISKLGTPASSGCIRLHPDNAAKLFALTRMVGLRNMTVIVQD